MKPLLMTLAVAAVLQASPVTWQLKNAKFTDGATATGYLVYDASVGKIADYNIVVTGGDTAVFPDFTFALGTPNNTQGIWSPVYSVLFFETTFFNGHINALQLRLALPSPLTDAGGTVLLDLANLWGGECYDCDPYRTFVSGELDSVPEPASGATAVLVVTGWALLRRRRLV